MQVSSGREDPNAKFKGDKSEQKRTRCTIFNPNDRVLFREGDQKGRQILANL